VLHAGMTMINRRINACRIASIQVLCLIADEVKKSPPAGARARRSTYRARLLDKMAA
jgi:hypothetical protein